jgi:hypothetical protein
MRSASQPVSFATRYLWTFLHSVARSRSPRTRTRALFQERRRITRRQIQAASVVYALVITLTAIIPGFVFSPRVLLLYFASSIIVAIAVARDLVE